DVVGAVGGLARVLAGRAARRGVALRAAGGLLAALNGHRRRFGLGRGRLRGGGARAGGRRRGRGRGRRGGVAGRGDRGRGFAGFFWGRDFRRGGDAADGCVARRHRGREAGGGQPPAREGAQNSAKSSPSRSGGRHHAFVSFICGSSHVLWSAHLIHVTGYAHRSHIGRGPRIRKGFVITLATLLLVLSRRKYAGSARHV